MNKLNENFKNVFGAKPKYLITAPARASLSGIHVDYFQGVTVNIAASNLAMRALILPRDDGKVRFYSANLNDKIHILNSSSQRAAFQSLQYIQGAREVYKQKSKKRKINGFDIYVSSSIPIGGGMSSSSALSVIGALSFSLVNGFLLEDKFISRDRLDQSINDISNQNNNAKKILTQIAHIAGEAEWWYGTKGGKMDQFTIALAKRDKVFVLDNKDFSFNYLDWPDDVSIVVCDTNVAHNQKKSGYDNTKKQAEKAFKKISNIINQEINSFRDVDLPMLDRAKNKLTDLEYRRSLHPVSEMKERVPNFLLALEKGDSRQIGDLLSQTYFSLRDNYGTSCQELDLMYDLAKNIPGFLGATISGGGFGGCVVALVEDDKLSNFIEKIEQKYNQNPGIKSKKIKGQFVSFISGRGVSLEKIF